MNSILYCALKTNECQISVAIILLHLSFIPLHCFHRLNCINHVFPKKNSWTIYADYTGICSLSMTCSFCPKSS